MTAPCTDGVPEPGRPGLCTETLLRAGDALGDVVLLLDEEGRIEGSSGTPEGGFGSASEAWEGRPWSETVSRDQRRTVAGLLAEARHEGVSGCRLLHQVAASGRTLPISFTVFALSGDRGFLALGRDRRELASLRQRLTDTEQALERDYRRLRQSESRFRLLLGLFDEAVLVVHADSHRSLDANDAALELLGVEGETRSGVRILDRIEPVFRAEVQSLLSRPAAGELVSRLQVRLLGCPEEVVLRASPFRSEGDALWLLRIESLDPRGPAREPAWALPALVQASPDAVVVTDGAARVQLVNPAFLELCHLMGPEHARGRWLGDWVGGPGNDLPMVGAILKSHGSVRSLHTSLRGEDGRVRSVELSAAAVSGGPEPLFGFFLRAHVGRDSESVETVRDLAQAVQQLSVQVGRISLPDLVRETTTLVERHFIEAALELTGGNRTTAADLLGLSRQSLYVKLRRQGLDEPSAPVAQA